MGRAQRAGRSSWAPRRASQGPDAQAEQQARRLGFRTICGVDEAGRGPLAGPVVAAAVVLPFDFIGEGEPISGSEGPGAAVLPDELAGLNDSKQLTEARREQLFAALCQMADVSIASLSAPTIDSRNIRKASLDAMRLAILGLPHRPHFALIDGTDEPPALPCAAATLVKGDGRSLSIAAASICAKVARDRMMVAADRLYPGYSFAAHKGYATQSHRDALARLGPCHIHRRSFAPVREAAIAKASG